MCPTDASEVKRGEVREERKVEREERKRGGRTRVTEEKRKG